MKFAIIWTWLQPRDSVQDVSDANPLEPKQRVGYFCTLAEAMATFNEPSFGEKELVAILETRGDCAKQEEA